MKIGELEYELLLASDVIHDGMCPELWRVGNDGDRTQIMDAFWRDPDSKFTFSCYEKDVPFEVVEFFVAEARKRLPPVQDRDPG